MQYFGPNLAGKLPRFEPILVFKVSDGMDSPALCVPLA
jgi:hypothetical protein